MLKALIDKQYKKAGVKPLDGDEFVVCGITHQVKGPFAAKDGQHVCDIHNSKSGQVKYFVVNKDGKSIHNPRGAYVPGA